MAPLLFSEHAKLIECAAVSSHPVRLHARNQQRLTNLSMASLTRVTGPKFRQQPQTSCKCMQKARWWQRRQLGTTRQPCRNLSDLISSRFSLLVSWAQIYGQIGLHLATGLSSSWKERCLRLILVAGRLLTFAMQRLPISRPSKYQLLPTGALLLLTLHPSFLSLPNQSLISMYPWAGQFAKSMQQKIRPLRLSITIQPHHAKFSGSNTVTSLLQ